VRYRAIVEAVGSPPFVADRQDHYPIGKTSRSALPVENKRGH
jgi:hypothetical protein